MGLFGKDKNHTPEEYGAANLIGLYLIGKVQQMYGDPGGIQGLGAVGKDSKKKKRK